MKKEISPVRKARLLRGLTQLDISFPTGINLSKISMIERGYIIPRPEEKRLIAMALETTVSEIFPENGNGR